MKKALSILLSTTLVLACVGTMGLTVLADGLYGGGSGTDADPYIIENEVQFDNIRENPSAVYRVTDDIDLTELASPYVPIAFTGKISGSSANMERLKKININLDLAVTNTALFTTFGGGGSISYLEVTGTVNSTSTYTAGFVGTLANGTVTNCINSATITSAGNYVGGIAGSSNSYASKIEYCANKGTVGGAQNVAGIVGFARGTVSKCANKGAVTGSGHYVGGIVGSSTGGLEVSECYNMANIRTLKNGGTAAGIAAGITKDSLSISNCYNIGNVSSSFGNASKCGIFCSGTNFTISNSYNAIISTDITNPVSPTGGTVTDCYYLSDTAADDGVDNTTPLTAANMANLANFTNFSSSVWAVLPDSGYLFPQLINNPHPEAERGLSAERPILINSAADFAEILGAAEAGKFYSITADITLPAAYEPIALGNITLFGSDAENLKTITVSINKPSSNDVGLFSTVAAGAAISNLRLAGSVAGASNVGGFVGRFIANATISNCVNEAQIAAAGNYVGGIVGDSSNSYLNSIVGCVNKGAVSGNASIAGIVGYARGTVSKCANKGEVTGNESGGNNAGGIVGYSRGGLTVSECYNMADILGKKNGGYVGGIAGSRATSTLTITNCYNIGNVKSTFGPASAEIGGICGSAVDVTISNSYNGKISSDIEYPVCPAGATVTNCYYLSDTAEDDGIANTTPLTSASMKSFASFTGFSDSVWTILSESGYFYPQLINNPHPTVERGSSAEFPIIIASAEDFELLRNGGDGKYYSVTANIVLPSSYEPFELSDAYLFGADAENLKSVNVSIDKTGTDNVGLFTSVSGLVQIKNLKLTGSITGNDYVGGFIGQMGDVLAGSYIKNCVNEADINGNNYVGGISGQSTTINILYSNLINKGDISGVNDIGGISGVSADIYLSRNLGNVSGNNYVGGIVGLSYGSIYTSYNNGEITGGYAVGGILGTAWSNNRKIQNCYNTGNVTSLTASETDNEVGGILGNLRTDKSFTVDTCYNIGEVKSALGNYNPIAPACSALAAGCTYTITNCYYASPNGADDGKDGTTPVTREGLASLTIAGEGSLFEASSDENYAYPQITGNEQAEALTLYTVTTSADANLVVSPLGANYAVSGNTFDIAVSANDNYMIDCINYGSAVITSLYNKKSGIYAIPAITADITVTVTSKAFELPLVLEAAQLNFVPEDYGVPFVISETPIATPYGMSFSKIPEYSECELVEYGMIFSKTNSALNMNSYDAKAPATGKNAAGQFGVLFYGSGISANTTYYTRAYAIYEKDGVRTVVLGAASQFETAE